MEGIDRRISELRTVLDRATGNLVELDADVTRQLLESSTSLRGVTAESWADASRRHAELWRGQFALESVLTQIAETRGTRRSLPQTTLIRLDQLLGTECVELPRPAATGLPRLTDGPAPTISLTIEDALRQMSEDYEVVARVVAAVAEIWGEPTDRLHRVAGEVEELEQRLRDQGARPSNELQAIARAVAETELLARDDPLALSSATLEELQARVGRLRASLEEILRGARRGSPIWGRSRGASPPQERPWTPAGRSSTGAVRRSSYPTRRGPRWNGLGRTSTAWRTTCRWPANPERQARALRSRSGRRS